MPDGVLIPPAWPLLLDERTAARMLSLALRDFRLGVQHGLLPAGRTPADFARAGLIDHAAAARLATLGPLWHRAEIEARAATLYGLEGQARVGQAAQAAAAQEALREFTPPRPAARPARQARR